LELHEALLAAEALGLLLGFLLAFRAGGKIAARRHDAELARRHGRRLPGGLGLVFYLLVLASLLVNLTVVLAMAAVKAVLKLFLGAATGHLVGAAGGVAVTLAGLLLGYLYYSHRYRGVEEPLTREGRIALRGIELGDRAASATRQLAEKGRGLATGLQDRLPGPPWRGERRDKDGEEGERGTRG